LSIRDHEYGASLDLQQLYPFRMKLRFVEVGSVEAENPRTRFLRVPDLEPGRHQFAADSPLEGDGFELPVPELVGGCGFEAGRVAEAGLPDLRRDAALPVRQNTRQGREGGALLNPYFTCRSARELT
jgi:hypothetical protein